MTEPASDARTPVGDSPPGRVVVVGTNYAPEPTGTGPYTAIFAEALHQGGFDVGVLAGVPHYPGWSVTPGYRFRPTTREHINGVRVRRFRHHVPKRPTLHGRALMEGSFLAPAAAAVGLARADAIVAITPPLADLAAALGGARGRPVGAIVQDLTGAAAFQTGATGGGVASAITRAEMAMLRRCKLVGVVAEGFRAVLMDGGVLPERIVHLPNPVRVVGSDLSASAARAALGWPDGRPLAVHTGNMGLKQGLDQVLDAAELAPEIDFVLVGDGADRSRLAELAQQRQLPNLRMVPPVDEDDYPVVLAAADVLVLSEAPSVEAMSLPSKVTSYVAAQRPIVAAVRTDGITAEYLNQTGVATVCPVGGAHLADSLRRVLTGGDEYADQIQAQRVLLADLAPARAVSRYQAFAQQLIDSNS